MARVEQKPDTDPVPYVVLAQSIAEIADAMKKIRATRLRQDTLVTLLAHTTKLPRKDITYVLNALDSLEIAHLKPKL